MPMSSRNRSIDTNPARHRLCALLAVGLLIAQLLVWWAPTDQADAATTLCPIEAPGMIVRHRFATYAITA